MPARQSSGALGCLMFFGVPLSELAWLVLLVIAGGVVTGVLAGLFGIGGGGIIVPILYEVFGVLGVPAEVRLQLCIATSIAIVLPTNVRSLLTHRRQRAVLMDVLHLVAFPAVVELHGFLWGAARACDAPAAARGRIRDLFVVGVGALPGKPGGVIRS